VNFLPSADTETVQLLAAEVDAIDSPMAGGAPPLSPPPTRPPPRPNRLTLPPRQDWKKPGFLSQKPAQWVFLGFFFCFFLVFFIFAQKREFLGFFQFLEYF
jgi:hypothetical protein